MSMMCMLSAIKFSECSYNWFSVTNPSNGSVIGAVPDMTATDTEAAIQCAYKAFQTWKKTTAKVLHLLSSVT